MENKVDLDALTRKTHRLEFEDGLIDIQNALVFAFLGTFGALTLSPAGIRFYMTALLANRELMLVGLIGIFGLFILVTYGARRLIMRYRRQVLWKDRGQFEPLRSQVDSRISILSTAVWLIVFIAGVIMISGDPMDLDSGMRVVIGAGGLATGLIYVAMGQTLQLLRYRWLGVIAGILSGGLMILPSSAAMTWIAFGLIWTVGLITSGISAWRRARAKN